MIRLEHIRARSIPGVLGVSSENAAHRVAVLWEADNETREGVFVSRRDTNSRINQLLGGRIFPGEHNLASFSVNETESEIKLEMQSEDGEVNIEIAGRVAAALPSTSIFSSIAESSSFFEGGSVGYSVTRDKKRLDGLRLQTRQWAVDPLAVDTIYSNYFRDQTKFPEGAAEFDHALIMRNIEHEWHSADDLYV